MEDLKCQRLKKSFKRHTFNIFVHVIFPAFVCVHSIQNVNCDSSGSGVFLGWGAADPPGPGHGLDDLIRQPDPPPPLILPCGTTLTLGVEQEVYVETPNFSNAENYPNSLVCTWELLFPGRRAKLSCPNFDLAAFLCFDNFQVDDDITVRNRYCGQNGPTDVILTDKAIMRFSSSAFFNSVGFRCSLKSIEEDDKDPPKPSLYSSCTCGINAPGTKIINGTEAKPGEVPWQAGLVRSNGTIPFCGGSLINDRYILTAGHCVVGKTPYNLEILLEKVVVTGTKIEVQMDRHSVVQIMPHRQYTASLDYDAALVKLAKPVNLTTITPVCLPQMEDLTNDYRDTTSTVTGWGYTSESGGLSKALRKANVRVMSMEECSKLYSSLTDRMMCAAAPGTDACQGDSGGPLFYESDRRLKKHTQIGIVSWGIGCGRPKRPGVYTRVTEIMKWVNKVTTDGSYCKEGFPEFNATIHAKTRT